MPSDTAKAMIQKLREVTLPLIFSTILLYLYATYSIKPKDKQGKEARDKFRGRIALPTSLIST